MSDFIITSLIASIVLTFALNLFPAIFPKSAEKAKRKIIQTMEDAHEKRMDPNTPKLRVFFPWKSMLVISILLTMAVNIIAGIAR